MFLGRELFGVGAVKMAVFLSGLAGKVLWGRGLYWGVAVKFA